MRFRKPAPFELFFMACATLLFCSLGIWQIERLQWKQGEIARIQAAQGEPALGSLPQDIEGLAWRDVALTGTFMHEKAFHLVGSKQDQGQGFFILTPFTLEDDGRVILVNRGFSPPGKETLPEGVYTLRGVIRPAREKRYFSPENQPSRNVWFYEDASTMSDAAGLTLTPLIVEETGTPQKDIYPIPSNGKVSLRNDHLQYTITWFSLALVGLVMFGFYLREKETA